ncbi:hypothetical protein KQY30_24845 [Streptomyces sp. GMY02]|uniref:hypothetical protein n=1 Tax=Streptomyces sp. GMY02 TaxID=1333528 RepID=UPI001C2CBC63|nr:hypothetical protein [Streptomyces sp. GMY02]QXE39645.1 hypothetical protein KQY30_24845 [Streptomyces sp. GMY02]
MADLAQVVQPCTTPINLSRRLVAVGSITRRDGRTTTVRATEAGVTGTITPTAPTDKVWSIRELDHLFQTHGGTVTVTAATATTVTLTLTAPNGRVVSTDWDPAAELHGLRLPVYRAYIKRHCGGAR